LSNAQDNSNASVFEIDRPERDLNSRSLSRTSCPKITSHGNLPSSTHTTVRRCLHERRTRLSVTLCDKRMKHYGAVNHTRRTHKRNFPYPNHRIMPQIVLNEFDGVRRAKPPLHFMSHPTRVTSCCPINLFCVCSSLASTDEAIICVLIGHDGDDSLGMLFLMISAESFCLLLLTVWHTLHESSESRSAQGKNFTSPITDEWKSFSRAQ